MTFSLPFPSSLLKLPNKEEGRSWDRGREEEEGRPCFENSHDTSSSKLVLPSETTGERCDHMKGSVTANPNTEND